VVARAFAETSRRREVLSFKHHTLVAGPARPTGSMRCLTGAKKRWSTRELRAEIGRRLSQRAERMLRRSATTADAERVPVSNDATIAAQH
jgi:hypothetical protein